MHHHEKLERMGNVIFTYGMERFGVVEGKQSTPTIHTKSRRQKEIDWLIKERHQLKKLWRKATEEEKEGINLWQEEIKGRLATLRKGENLLKKHRTKEQTRSRFYKDPFKLQRVSLQKKILEVSRHSRASWKSILKDPAQMKPGTGLSPT